MEIKKAGTIVCARQSGSRLANAFLWQPAAEAGNWEFSGGILLPSSLRAPPNQCEWLGLLDLRVSARPVGRDSVSHPSRHSAGFASCCVWPDNGGIMPSKSLLFPLSSILFRPLTCERTPHQEIGGGVGYRPRVRSAYFVAFIAIAFFRWLVHYNI